MYDESFNSPIFADCILVHDQITLKGNVLLKRDSDKLELFVKETIYNNITEVSGKTSQCTIKIKKDSTPFDFYCEITNFPNANRVTNFIDKNIILKLHKVRVQNDFLFTLSDQYPKVKLNLIPLYDLNGEIGSITAM